MFHRLGAQVSVGLAALSVLLQCSRPEEPPQAAAKYTGDLTEMRSRGKLRAIVPLEAIEYMPRHGEQVTLSYDVARELAEAFEAEARACRSRGFLQNDGDAARGRGRPGGRQPDHNTQNARSKPRFRSPICMWTNIW